MTTKAELFAEAEPNRPEDGTNAHDPLELAARRLAVQFTEDDQLPARYRRRADSEQKKREVKQDSEVERRFKANVQAWRSLIETMLTKLKPEQAWRFINLVPQIDGDLAKVSDNTDFCEFIDYLILRRDKKECDSEELGRLAQLSTAFQREVEKRIQQD